MPNAILHTLVLHDIDDAIIAAIKAKAAANGSSTEDQILQLLSEALFKPTHQRRILRRL